MAQKTGKRKIRNREQLAQILELRKAGATLEAIGNQFGITKGRVHQIIDAALQELNEQCSHGADELRRMQEERLDSMRLALWKQRNNPRVADTLLRIEERLAKLRGLDAPLKVAPTTPDGAALPSGGMDLSRLSMDELHQLESIHRKAAIEAPKAEA